MHLPRVRSLPCGNTSSWLVCLAMLMVLTGWAAAEEPAGWQMGEPIALDGVSVKLSRPVLVARSSGYLWFPTLAKLSDGRILATMSNYADKHVAVSTSAQAFSDDGGLTWSKPSTALFCDVHLRLPNGDEMFLPYYMQPSPDGGMTAPFQIYRAASQSVEPIEKGLSVSGWPRPDKGFAPELGLSGFVFSGQAVELPDQGYLATLYGWFEGDKRFSLVAAESADGKKWKIRSTIAGPECRLPGWEGPCEAALCRLKDGRLLCVYRLAGYVPLGQSFSSDEGRTWTSPQPMKGPFSVQPSLAAFPSGRLALSGGRPGVVLWLNLDGQALDWQAVDLQAHHDACHPKEPITTGLERTSSYTEVIATGEGEGLVIYDRIPKGWREIPADSPDTNSVWVVRFEAETSTP
ncbi:MAG: sialidase family protein [Pirellulales bacterium]